MGTVISIVNLKGGVGKTTCTANIAGELALGNRKVLVVDADAQANLSTLLMGPKRYEKEILKLNTPEEKSSEMETIYQIFMDAIDEKNNFDSQKAIRKNVVKIKKKGEFYQPLANLDLLPASFHLMELERRIVTFSRTKFILLYKVIQDLKKEYDFIFIDCPPNIYTATHNALYASDYYIIPTTPEFLSITGIPLLVNSLRKTIQIKNDERNENVGCLGIIINMFTSNLNIHKQGVTNIEKMLEFFKENKWINEGASLFETKIRDLVDIKKATGEYAPVCVAYPNSASTGEFRTLCGEILKNLKEGNQH